ncbi:Uncharacterised protein [Chlamydia trachomatis]|nr:Uncharacterised protein [Chlamydia trachomatis]
MRDAHSGIRSVYALSARARRLESIHTNVRIWNVNMICSFNKRNYFHGTKASLTPALIVEWRNTNHSVSASFYRKATIRIWGIYLESGGFNTSFFCVRRIHHLSFIAVSLCPTQVHSKKHLSKIGSIHTTRTRTDCHHRCTSIIFAIKKSLNFHIVQLVSNRAKLLLSLAHRISILFFLTKFNQSLSIFNALLNGL